MSNSTRACLNLFDKIPLCFLAKLILMFSSSLILISILKSSLAICIASNSKSFLISLTITFISATTDCVSLFEIILQEV